MKTILFTIGLIIMSGLTLSAQTHMTVSVKKVDVACSKGAINLSTQNATDPVYFNWNDGATGPVRAGLDPGKYFVTVQDATGYDTTVSVEIVNDTCIVSVPLVFTPNGDGINDELSVSNTSHFPNYQFQIFNRWGQVVHSQEGPDFKSWDGKWLNVSLPPDAYYYVFIYDKNHKSIVKTGSISIVK